MTRVGQLALIPVVFVAIGPFVGLAIFSVAAEAYAWAFLRGVQYGNGLIFMVLGLPFAHLVGAIPVTMAGFLVALLAALQRRAPLWQGFASGLLVGLALMVYLRRMPGSKDTDILPTLEFFVIGMSVASVVCTRLTRRWH